MTHRFDPSRGLIVLPVRIFGLNRDVVVRMALDTGATCSILNTDLVVFAGYDVAASPERIQVTTGSGVEYAPRIKLTRLESLGLTRKDFPLLCHTLPPSATVDGLLGLDFFRGVRLSLDFVQGNIDVDNTASR